MSGQDGLGLSQDGSRQIKALNQNLERMISACMTLSSGLANYEQRLEAIQRLIDESLGPILMAVDQKLDRLDGVMDAIIDGAHSNDGTKRGKAMAVIEKLQEIFEICEE